MNTSNLQTDKLDLIAQITLIEDSDLINELKNVLNSNFTVPEWQKNIVRERIKKNKHKIENYTSLEDLDKHIQL